VQITEVKLTPAEPGDKVLAYGSFVIDGVFIVRDVRVLATARGPLVAMPSRRLRDRCPTCLRKNDLQSRYCSQCGARLAENRAVADDEGRLHLHNDVAFPCTKEARAAIEAAVLAAYERETRGTAVA